MELSQTYMEPLHKDLEDIVNELQNTLSSSETLNTKLDMLLNEIDNLKTTINNLSNIVPKAVSLSASVDATFKAPDNGIAAMTYRATATTAYIHVKDDFGNPSTAFLTVSGSGRYGTLTFPVIKNRKYIVEAVSNFGFVVGRFTPFINL